MSDEQTSGQAAADAGTDDDQKLAASQAGEPGTGTAGEGTEVQPYTPEELEAWHPMDSIDLNRIADPASRKAIEKAQKEYKALQSDQVRTRQELAELKKTPPEPEIHFADPRENEAFEKQYLKNPIQFVSDVNAEIARLEGIIPDDGAEEYRTARRNIAYWNGLKDRFSLQRTSIIDRQRRAEVEETKTRAELGDHAESIEKYATETLGYSLRDFRTNPQIRQAVKKTYEIANAASLASTKVVKPQPQKTSSPSGQAAGGEGAGDERWLDPKLSTEERIALFRKTRQT